jgi:hypothetical protein
VAQVRHDAAIERAIDEQRARLAAARMSDLGRVTRHGVATAFLIAADAEVAAEAAPWAAREIIAIAQVGLHGLRSELAGLADHW